MKNLLEIFKNQNNQLKAELTTMLVAVVKSMGGRVNISHDIEVSVQDSEDYCTRFFAHVLLVDDTDVIVAGETEGHDKHDYHCKTDDEIREFDDDFCEQTRYASELTNESLINLLDRVIRYRTALDKIDEYNS